MEPIGDADLSRLYRLYGGLPPGPYEAVEPWPGAGFKSVVLCAVTRDDNGVMTGSSHLGRLNTVLTQVRLGSTADCVAGLLNAFPGVFERLRRAEQMASGEAARNAEQSTLIDQQIETIRVQAARIAELERKLKDIPPAKDAAGGVAKDSGVF